MLLTNAQYHAPSSVFLMFLFTGHPKPNQPLQPLFHRLRIFHLLITHQNGPMATTHPTKKIFQVSDAPTPIYDESQLNIYIIKANHLTSRVQQIFVPIQYVYN